MGWTRRYKGNRPIYWGGRYYFSHNRRGNSHVLVYDKSGDPTRVEGNSGPLIVNETLLFKILGQLFLGEEYIDHYRPAWLINPLTGHRLEIDRYYPRLRLAFEYNGRHHQGQKQRAKDAVKIRVCREKGVALVTIPSAQQIDRRTLEQLVEQAKTALADNTG